MWCVWGKLDRSLTHCPSSQGFASKCPVFVYVCVVFSSGLLLGWVPFFSLCIHYLLVCYIHVFSLITLLSSPSFSHTSLSGGRVSLTQTSFTVRENETLVRVCARFTKYIIRPDCPMDTVVNINFVALSNTAGIHMYCTLSILMYVHVCMHILPTNVNGRLFSPIHIALHMLCTSLFTHTWLHVSETRGVAIDLKAI